MAHAALSNLGSTGPKLIRADRYYVWVDPAALVELDADIQQERLRLAAWECAQPALAAKKLAQALELACNLRFA